MNVPTPSAQVPPRRPQTSGLCIASVILGLLGFCGGVTSLPAVICGHLGLGKIKRSGGQLGGTGLAIAGLITGYLCLIGALGFWGVMAVGYRDHQRGEAEASELFDIGSAAIPELPGRPEFQEIGDTGVRVGAVTFPAGDGPGAAMEVWVYLPAGEHPAGSLKAVLVAPAGTDLLSGMELGPVTDDAYHDECLPYAEAGMAVVMYSLDGHLSDEDIDSEEPDALTESYNSFVKSGAGVINARNALEYTLARLPEVDPAAIYSAGHSSSGTLSLLFGEHEPRLAGVLAYAPATDVEKEHAERAENPFAGLLYPNLDHFIKRSSPKTHAAEMKHPIFLFHAEDDSRIPVAATREFAEDLKARGVDVTLEIVPDGEHYDSMIDQGIPAGIEWVKGR